MSHLSYPKKLLPVKRPWRSLTRSLRSKLKKLKDSKFIRTSTRRLLSSPLLYRILAPFKRQSLPKTSKFRHFQPYQYQYYRNNRSPIYIDGLFDEDRPRPCSYNSSTRPVIYHEKGETSKAKEETREKIGNHISAGQVGYDVDEVWRNLVASSPQLRCVDERAEDFISKFRKDMQLQRERSLLEFQEILKRSA